MEIVCVDNSRTCQSKKGKKQVEIRGEYGIESKVVYGCLFCFVLFSKWNKIHTCLNTVGGYQVNKKRGWIFGIEKIIDLMKILINVQGDRIQINGEGIFLKQEREHPFHVAGMEKVKIIHTQARFYPLCLETETTAIPWLWFHELRCGVMHWK